MPFEERAVARGELSLAFPVFEQADQNFLLHELVPFVVLVKCNAFAI